MARTSRRPLGALAVVGLAVLFAAGAPAAVAAEYRVGDLVFALDAQANAVIAWKGATIFQDGFGVYDRAWKSLYPIGETRPVLTVDGTPDRVIVAATLEKAGFLTLRKRVTVLRDEVAVELDYTVAGKAGAAVADYFLKVPEPLLSGAPYKVWTALLSRESTIRPTTEARETTVEANVESMLVSTARGRLTFDLAATRADAPADVWSRRDGNGWNLNDIHTMPWGKGFYWFSQKQNAVGGKDTTCALRVVFRIEPTGPAAFVPLDLRGAANLGFRDEVEGDGKGGWTDQGANDLRNLPVGRQILAGIPFEIIDPAANGGRSCLVARGGARPGLPATFVVPVGRAARSLYFLHACAFVRGADETVATYQIRFRGGRLVEVPLRARSEICDWWSPKDTAASVIGWSGLNAAGKSVGLTVFAWSNPYAEVIDEVALVSSGTAAVPIWVAATASDAPPRLARAERPPAATDTSSWFPFNLAWDDTSTGWTDVSFLLDAPAGKHGFLTAREGHFYFADGTRGRFWGTNLTGNACYPTHEQAEKIARRLAKFGCNIARIHIHDTSGTMADETGKFEGIFDVSQGNTLTIAPSRLDRLDYLVAQLKKNGIYINMDLLTYRRFKEGDGVRDADQFYRIGGAAIATLYDERLIELQKQYATAILTHLNPYTGTRYVDEPALALVEMTNENGLFQLGSWTSHTPPPSYVLDLKARWNRWLLARYGERAKLAADWTNAAGESGLGAAEDPAAGTVELPTTVVSPGGPERPYRGNLGPARTSDGALFYYEVETAFYSGMREHLRALGLRVPVCGTNMPMSPAHLRAVATLDFTDQHYYWDHPSMFHPVTIRNRASLLENPLQPSTWQRDAIPTLAAAKVAGKPFFCTEWGFPFPNQYRAEGPLLLAAYACLQDWDGLTATHYNDQAVRLPEGAIRGPFVIYNDPLTFGQFPAAALLFHRRDVAAARRLIQVGYSRTDAFNCQSWNSLPSRFLPYVSRVESYLFADAAGNRYGGSADVVVSSGLSGSGDYTGAPRSIVYANTPWCDLRNRTRGTLEALDASAFYARFQAKAAAWGLAELQQEAGRLRSDNGQVGLDYQRHLLRLDTPRTQGAVGFLGGAKVELQDVVIECQTGFAAVTVSALDDASVGASRRCLLTALARAENSGQLWNDSQTKLLDPGQAPILLEPVAVSLTFKGKRGLVVHALDATGKAVGQIPARNTADGTVLTLGPDAKTCFFAVESE
jgi:hypothetical protein